jgi:hypothetical protein
VKNKDKRRNKKKRIIQGRLRISILRSLNRSKENLILLLTQIQCFSNLELSKIGFMREEIKKMKMKRRRKKKLKKKKEHKHKIKNYGTIWVI